MTTKITSSTMIFFVLAVLTACGPNQRILESANENTATAEPVAVNSNPGPAVSTFEQDLNAMRTADFKFIVVFRRKDGQALTPQDKALIGTNTGMQANRRRVSDEDRAVIIGGNFPFATKLMNELTERFKMENYSKADSGPLTSDALNPDSGPVDVIRRDSNRP